MKVKAYYKVKKYCLVDIWSKKEQYPFFFYKVFTYSLPLSNYLQEVYTKVQISLPFLIYNVFPVQGQISLSFSFSKVLTRPNQCLDLHDVYTLLTCS